jgi:hypothetical protein
MFKVSKLLLCKIYWQKDPKDKSTVEYILNFSGVMSKNERDELIKNAPKSDNFKKAIFKLYEDSQHLDLRNFDAIAISYVPKQFGGPGVNEYHINLTSLFKDGQVKYHPSQDVAFVKIGIPQIIEGQKVTNFIKGVTKTQGQGSIGVGPGSVKFFKDVIVGNEVFIFGYPTSITEINPWMDTKMPLLRKGIVAGKNEALNAIILDCPAFFGNSGGLVIEVERMSLTGIKYMAIGLITQFVPFDKGWFQNSGYSVVVPMDFVENLITGQTE